MPCPECGVSVACDEVDEHSCDPEDVLDFAVFQFREEFDELDDEVSEYLDTPLGRFEAWDAERRRRDRD